MKEFILILIETFAVILVFVLIDIYRQHNDKKDFRAVGKIQHKHKKKVLKVEKKLKKQQVRKF